MLYSTFKAADLAGANINVNCIVPGLIYTPLWEMGAAAYNRGAQVAGESQRCEFLCNYWTQFYPSLWYTRFEEWEADTMSFHFNIHKVTQAVALLLSQEEGKKMNYMKLIKLLYIADRESLKETSAPITGDTHVVMKYGAVLSTTYDLIMDREWQVGYKVWSDYLRTEGVFLVLVQDPGIENLCPYEIDKLTSVFQKHKEKSGFDLAALTHEFEEVQRHETGDSSSKIPLPHTLEAVGRKDDIDDILQDEADAEFFAKLFED